MCKPSAVEPSHARTRLEEERHLFERVASRGVEAVSLRVGMVYGRGILMIDAARWFSRRGLLGVWRKPTGIHLISTIDFLNAAKSAVLNEGVSGGDRYAVMTKKAQGIASRPKKAFMIPN